MKIYVIKGTEGEPGFVKQSMKLPKSWSTKQIGDVLALFVESHNKKVPSSPIDAGSWHLEKPLGSTLYPDDQVGSVLTEYCDVFCVEGKVAYKGPPPGTAAALEAKEALEKKARASSSSSSEKKSTWEVRVRCVSLDRGGMDVKSKWKEGDVARVPIEPHATVGMLANRIGLIVGAHPKHQQISFDGRLLSPLDKLEDVAESDAEPFDLVVAVPDERRELEELSDDEGYTGPEDEPPSSVVVVPDECADFERQAALKSRADELLLSGEEDNKKAALAAYDEAIGLGAPSAALLCKRGDLLLKSNRPVAAAADADKALAANPDSAKAYRLRAKARRKLGLYDEAAADFGQAQRIDFDSSVVQEQTYVAKRAAKIRANKLIAAEINNNQNDEDKQQPPAADSS